jgi:steroid Delta-isomerase
MPSSAIMKAAMQSYIDTYNSGDAEAVVALFADDAVVEDPFGTPSKRGKQELLAFYRYSISTGAKLSLDVPIRGSHGNAAAMAFSATLEAMTIRVIDVMTFDEAGKFTSMKAYFAPDDIIA